MLRGMAGVGATSCAEFTDEASTSSPQPSSVQRLRDMGGVGVVSCAQLSDVGSTGRNAPPAPSPVPAVSTASIDAAGRPLFIAGDHVELTPEAVVQYRSEGHDFDDPDLNAIKPGQSGEAVRVYQWEGDWWVTVANQQRQSDYPAQDLRLASSAAAAASPPAPPAAPPAASPAAAAPAAGPGAPPLFCAGDRVALTSAAVEQYRKDGHDFLDQSLNAIMPGEAGEAARLYECDGEWWVTVATKAPDGGLHQCDYPATDLHLMAQSLAASRRAGAGASLILQSSPDSGPAPAPSPAAPPGRADQSTGQRRSSPTRRGPGGYAGRIGMQGTARGVAAAGSSSKRTRASPPRLNPVPDGEVRLARIRGRWHQGGTTLTVDGANVQWADGTHCQVHLWPATVTAPARTCVSGWTLDEAASTDHELVWRRGDHERRWQRAAEATAVRRRRPGDAYPRSPQGRPGERRGSTGFPERRVTGEEMLAATVGGGSTIGRGPVSRFAPVPGPAPARGAAVRSRTQEARLQANSEGLAAAISEMLGRARAVLFSRSGDPSCNRLKAELRRNKVQVEVIELDKMAAGDEQLILDWLSRKTYQRRVPQLFVDGEHVRTSHEALRKLEGR
eukprot:TRINITY_DN20910_c0_g3_i1.p1 TRINITY_DN20910_c0_g3~~TRINITY_DN20910_c0_g3_i1.p1  ORF type:complete len:616 (+),score=139.26 TRINITY_DN20910_c0_g3_i1:93-1940(+)